jgi:putative acetyltransferase
MIRPSTDDDVEEIVDVWYQASLLAHSFLSEDFLEKERREVEDEWLPIADLTVYESEQRVVGFLALIGNEVGAIFVRPDHHGRGIGRALMDHARAARPFLELDVFEANAIGRRFYDRYGFHVIDRHVHEETGEGVLRLRLD